MRKYKILIIAGLFLIIAVAGFWYVQKNDGNKDKDKVAFTTGFTMLDDEKNLVWQETVQLTTEARAQYENKIKEIKADLIVAKEKEQLLADYNSLAMYEKYLGNYRESYNAYLESLKLENLARVAWQNFADVLLEIGAVKSAEMAYKKAVELNKYIPESYVKLADYYKIMNNDILTEKTYKLAIVTIKESMENDTLVLSDYAEWLIGKTRYGDAIKILQELMVKQPANKAVIERKIEQLRINN
jgi:tetratricopeptide (TPR) repeat protein